MKGEGVGVGNHSQGKRRGRGMAIGVLFLVLLSLLVPLVFVLRLYKGFYSTGIASDQPGATSTNDRLTGLSFPPSVQNVPAKDASENNVAVNKTNVPGSTHYKSKGKGNQMVPPAVPQLARHINQNHKNESVEVTTSIQCIVGESEKFCELRFGSYCLWFKEHRENMKDSMVKRLKDQLFVARAYYPSIAKLPSQVKLSRELRQNIQELERVLSESSTDSDLPSQIGKKLKKMEAAIARAKTFHVDCNNVDKKLRQILDLTEDEANFHMRESSFLYQVAVVTMPRSLHCLSMRLTVEYFKSSLHDKELPLSEKYSDPTLQHYVIFSNNVLASSVAINSTVTHARESRNLVFHVLTDGQNYFAMKLWFLRYSYKEAAVQVLDIENLDLDHHDKASLISLFLPVEFRVSFLSVGNQPAVDKGSQYISVFSHTHFFLPYIFENLNKVIVLDDDVVVQQDLSDLLNLNMGGKVNAALQVCALRLGQLKSYLGENGFDKNSCAWMSGLNIIDLARWRELDLTATYQKVIKEASKGTGSIEAVALSASLLTFQDLVYPLDSMWATSGLGYNYRLDIQAIRNTAVLHYNGKMKPWLELGIPKYKKYWKRFVNREDRFLEFFCELGSQRVRVLDRNKVIAF